MHSESLGSSKYAYDDYELGNDELDPALGTVPSNRRGRLQGGIR